jgi:phosphotransacetylase
MSSPGAMPGAAQSELIMPSLRPSFARLCRQSKPVRLLFWESGDHRIVDAAALLNETGTVKVFFLGDEQEPSRATQDPGATRPEILAVGTARRAWLERSGYATSASPQSRCELAAAALAMHLVDAVVGGVATSSADVLRAGLTFVGLVPGTRTASIAGFVEPVAGPLAGRLLLMTDTGAVVDPTVDQFVDIVWNAIRAWTLVSNERPRVAFLSASTRGSSAAVPNVDRIRCAVEIIRAIGGEFDIDGELQLDAAIVPGVASAKGVAGAVAGSANILVFPGIDACNIGYKIAEHIGGAWTTPVTQGFARSYHDVSRGAELADLMGTCVMAAIMGSVAMESARTE